MAAYEQPAVHPCRVMDVGICLSEIQMLYQITYGFHGRAICTAMDYINASSYTEAWVMAQGRAMSNERVLDVHVISTEVK